MGMIVCLLLIIMGLVTLGKENECSHGSRSGIYDSGLATFGTDFYTYSNNNAAEAASASRITANNILELYDLLTYLFGWFFVFMGAIGLCHFGTVRAACSVPRAADIPLMRAVNSDINPQADETESNVPQVE